MRAIRATLGLVALALCATCASSPKPPGYEAAARAARKNAESVEGAWYLREVGRDLGRRRLVSSTDRMVRVCRRQTPDARGVHLLFRLDASGEPAETLVYPDSELGRCVREGLEIFPLPSPPEPDYWYSMVVPPAS